MFAFAESSFFPIPPDALMIPLALGVPRLALMFAAICTIASVAGGAFGYLIGLKGGRPVLQRLFSQDKIRLVETYYHKYDVWAVGIAGLTPLPYKLFTISAGVFALDFKRFVIASLIGRGARFFAVGLLIMLFGQAIQTFLDQYLEVAALLFGVGIIVGFYVVGFMARRITRRVTAAPES